MTSANVETEAGPYVQLHSGLRWHFNNPDPERVLLSDITFHLAHINRYNGAAGSWSVAQHSLLAAQLLDLTPSGPLSPDLRALVLLHDAHEFVTGDFPGPWKAKGEPAMVGAYTKVADDIQAAIHRRFGLETTPKMEREVELADDMSLAAEVRILRGHQADRRTWGKLKSLPVPLSAVRIMVGELATKSPRMISEMLGEEVMKCVGA